jgi:hypothetical protein
VAAGATKSAALAEARLNMIAASPIGTTLSLVTGEQGGANRPMTGPLLPAAP